ncbi:MAG: CpsD/CapB family tyrosine-protein kinase [Deltaproteobacteria bacterium]|nr:CpsD/CapB family tyrosine-protein kinase [Deltaproteobacteria bacterium]
MAKVYDALRRAEEDRKRLLGDNSNRPTPLEVEPVGPAAERIDRKPIWKRSAEALTPRPGPDGSAELNKRRISLLQPESYIAEQFRALRGRIDAIASQHPIRTIAITSAFPGEGKTTCAINLAIVTSMSLGRSVLLIDCDLRRPKIHPVLGMKPEVGLAEVLTGGSSIDEAIVSAEGVALDVLPVCGRPANPSELLGSSEMSQLVEDVAGRYDRVILDTPAALGLPDAKAVSDLCDGTVMVVRADVTARSELEAVLEILDRDRMLGLLINGVDADQGRYGYAK